VKKASRPSKDQMIVKPAAKNAPTIHVTNPSN